jgi:ClpP class serine protease
MSKKNTTPSGIDAAPVVRPSEVIVEPQTAEILDQNIIEEYFRGYGGSGSEEGKKDFGIAFSEKMKFISRTHSCSSKYNILVIYDSTSMVKSDSDRIYQAISSLSDKNKPLLLVLLSNGGEPGSAYLIGKLCRESSHGKFSVVVPRHAKSAATLLCCAADEIHMGGLSELGPIDPQMENKPMLGLKNSIETIAELVTKYPDSAEMFARYLARSVEPVQIGYYERAARSLEQYAEKLLKAHVGNLSSTPDEIAKKLVHEYKDHGFVIDKSEAESIFGPNVIKFNSEEYKLGNDLYLELASTSELANFLKYKMYFIGSLDSTPVLIKIKR